MAWCKLEDTVRNNKKFYKLAELLSIPSAHARGLFLGLCSWAITNAKDGILEGFSSSQIDEASDWKGRSNRLLNAYLQSGLCLMDGNVLQIAGFSRRNEGFLSNLRKRKQRESSKNVARHVRDTGARQMPECHAVDKIREDKIKESTKEKSDTHTVFETLDPYLENSKPTRDLELRCEKIYLSSKHDSLMTRLPPRERELICQLVASCSEPEIVLNIFLADRRDFYVSRGWPLSALIRDLAQHASKSEKPKTELNFYKPNQTPEMTPEEKSAAKAYGKKLRDELNKNLDNEARIERLKKMGIVSPPSEVETQ